MNPDRALALAVIERAILDAMIEGERLDGERALAKREALLFLTAPTGEWARSRFFWCACAEIDPAWLARQLGGRYGITAEPRN